MQNYPLLFGVEVVHEYFADPSRCRLSFLPDTASAAWLARAGCILRPSANGLKVFQEASRANGPTAGAVVLTFAVRPNDPNFGLYTAPLDPLLGFRGLDSTTAASGVPPAGEPSPVFDTADATRDPVDGALVMRSPATMGPFPAPGAAGVIAGLDMRWGFQLIVRVAASPPAAGLFCRVVLSSRAIVWKYVLTGDWSEDLPYVKDVAQALSPPTASPPTASPPTSPPMASPPAADGGVAFLPVAGGAQLADGRTAIAFCSNRAIALSDRPSQRLELWAAGGADAGRTLLKTLPAADPSNLALEDPADPSTLVCEIYVSR